MTSDDTLLLELCWEFVRAKRDYDAAERAWEQFSHSPEFSFDLCNDMFTPLVACGRVYRERKSALLSLLGELSERR